VASSESALTPKPGTGLSVDRYWGTLLGPQASPQARALVQLLGPAARAGESCLELSKLVQTQGVERVGEAPVTLSLFERELELSPAVARAVGATLVADQGQPFVLDDRGRLYFRRLYQAECRVAAHLVRLALAAPLLPDA
jgi:hypothetical protein